ncbi:helix-turn-helix domain-containing protein [Patescibacteria group bacterium]|nr:helix-turn-helix domain-containing protein [Patescibacteria group bacterium]MBU1663259.1 helix-turn-helix domain-containing protein [Patescibacteria group bacterium]MBU1934033.1 helix-turn-helix domain-containing protein [Patescibacteria group bacterium]MBU2007973.1 helix-turn-helix domain-containing protein [Patescibacteria group bacterium]MBU2264282.1 helix-turn-helix domain-containing protein [Patescibacteria group bacterium]
MDSETVSEQLRSARQAKKLKLCQIAKRLNINEKYLIALEKGEYEKLPHGVYEKNFLREYALFLSLDYKKLVLDYEAEINILEPKRQKEIFSKQVIKKYYLLAMPKILKNILIFLTICVCFIYLGYRVNKIISPPLLIINSPLADLTTNQTSLQIAGQTEAEASLIINGQTVLTDKNGGFSQIISLKNGINILTITANKQHSRSSTVIRQILVKK